MCFVIACYVEHRRFALGAGKLRFAGSGWRQRHGTVQVSHSKAEKRPGGPWVASHSVHTMHAFVHGLKP